MRGEETASSDLDLVVVFDRVETAKRQSFTFMDWPVEAFMHDVQTLEYFMKNVDRPTGVPSMSNMVNDGVEIPENSDVGLFVKAMAKQVLEAGPAPWEQAEREASRYAISNLVEDIRAPRNPDELRAVLAELYTVLATHYCRSQTQWAAKGKAIPRRLLKLDPTFHRQFTTAFETAFSTNETAAVIRLSQDVLRPDGGGLFDGYRREAPEGWRMPAS
ncbi:hypothetical protein BV911_10215 [Pseudoruegeria sp. SK021]|nr:hypothetical protein BV911_10215 [Pseudoruegeria sp. SK021]